MARSREARVFFPWEKRRGLRGLFARARGRQAIAALAALAAFAILLHRERSAAEIRATRATITTATMAVAAWQADHDRACPTSLNDLVTGGYLQELPRDAWGRPLRVVCPGRKDVRGFDVSSDGPDGEPGGRDRVE